MILWAWKNGPCKYSDFQWGKKGMKFVEYICFKHPISSLYSISTQNSILLSRKETLNHISSQKHILFIIGWLIYIDIVIKKWIFIQTFQCLIWFTAQNWLYFLVPTQTYLKTKISNKITHQKNANYFTTLFPWNI